MAISHENPARPATQHPEDDPFRYGWRYLRRDQPNGDVSFEQVPLTLEDVLHPQEEDFIVQSRQHQRICAYLYDILQARLGGDPAVVVASDLRILWDDPELKAHGPDIMVIIGVQRQKNWGTFRVAEEGTRPALIIEVTSPETRKLDLVDKLDHYEQAGVGIYTLIDIRERKGGTALRLLGYQLVQGTYRALSSDERGWLWLEPAGIWLSCEGSEVYGYDASGRRLGDYTAVDTALREAEARARQAEQRASAEAQARAQAEQAARQAEQRASAEAQARAQAEQRLQELEQELRRLRAER